MILGWQYATSFIDNGNRYHTGRYILGTFGEQRSGIDVRNNGPAMALLIERLYKRDGSLRLSPEEMLSAFNAMVRVALYDVHINNGTSYVVDLVAAQSTKLIGLGVEIPTQVDG